MLILEERAFRLRGSKGVPIQCIQQYGLRAFQPGDDPGAEGRADDGEAGAAAATGRDAGW